MNELARVFRGLPDVGDQPTQLAGLDRLELLLASRGDAELKEALTELDERASTMFVDVVRRSLGPELGTHPHVRGNIRALGLALYGLTLTSHLRSAAATDDVARDLRRITRQVFTD